MKEIEKFKKDYFLIFSKEILNNEALSPSERLLLALIIALDGDKGCHASNLYLSKFVNCSLGTISRSIIKLQKLGYIISNEENEDQGGRGHVRKVREDLKLRKAAKSISHSSPTKNTRQARENASPIYKEKKKDKLTSKNLSTKEEEQLARDLLNTSLSNKNDFYHKCKIKYNNLYPIAWDNKQIRALIELCNKLNETFGRKFVNQQTELPKILLEIFASLITNKPDFFKDSLPSTFVRFWNEAIQQQGFQLALRKTESRYRNIRDDEGF